MFITRRKDCYCFTVMCASSAHNAADGGSRCCTAAPTSLVIMLWGNCVWHSQDIITKTLVNVLIHVICVHAFNIYLF